MNNLKSYTEYAVSTPTTDFVIGFDFNYGTDAINVTVDGVPAVEAGYSVIYLNSTTMRLSPAVPSGVVRLQRETDIDVPDNQFTAGAKFIASNMDENFTQLRHAQQEVRDGFSKLSEDTYEIIDTLQVVGQAAQDAADAAEQAAQTANDAAAQVNDKVSYQDLDNAVEAAVTPVKDYIALPFNVDKSYALYERVQLDSGDIVKSTVVNNIANPNVDMSGWVLTNAVSQIVLANGLSQADKNKDFVFVEDYYAKGGALRPVSDLYTVGSDVYQKRFKDFADVQAFFPFVTAATDPLDWAATQKAVNENVYVRMRGVFYYWGDKVVEFPVNCLYFHGAGITTRIYTTGLKALKAKDGVRVVVGDYGHFYLVGNSTPNSIGFDTSAFSYCTFQNIWIRQYGDGWFADGSTSPVNKQYSNNTVINVRSNNNLRDGFRFVGSSEANSANTYIGCEGAQNANIGFNETVGYSNQTVGCTFQGNTVFDFYSDGERNIHEFYAEGKPKAAKLGALSKNNKVSVRSSYPLWNTFTDEGMDNNKSVRGELDVAQHIFRNPYFEDWSSSLPSGITLNGTPVAAFYADTNTQKGGGLQLTYNANFQGFIIQNLDPTVNYAKRWVTVQIEADTSGCTDLSAFRVYTREGANTNDATGTFAVTALEKTDAGKYKNFTFDVRFPDVITGNPNILVYLAYSGITTSNVIKIKAIKVALGQTDRVGEYALSQPTKSAVAASFTGVSSGLNTAFKYSGKVVYNSTVGKVYYASGPTPTSVWKALDGTADIVPS